MEINDFGDAIFYRASCHCTDKRCDMDLELELDKEFDMINLGIYEDLYYEPHWKTDNWFINKWYRITGALRLLFVGRIKVENFFIFEGEEQINDFVDTLKNGMKQLQLEAEKKKAEKEKIDGKN